MSPRVVPLLPGQPMRISPPLFCLLVSLVARTALAQSVSGHGGRSLHLAGGEGQRHGDAVGGRREREDAAEAGDRIRATRRSTRMRTRSRRRRTGSRFPTRNTDGCSTSGATARIRTASGAGRPRPSYGTATPAEVDDGPGHRFAGEGRGEELGLEGCQLPAAGGATLSPRRCPTAARMRSPCASSTSTTGQFVDGGFVLPQSKQDATWIDADTLLVARDWGAGTMTASGYPFVVKRACARTAARPGGRGFPRRGTDQVGSGAIHADATRQGHKQSADPSRQHVLRSRDVRAHSRRAR